MNRMSLRYVFPLVLLASGTLLSACSPTGPQANAVAEKDGLGNDVVLNDEVSADAATNQEDLFNGPSIANDSAIGNGTR
ncbi:hypothetical protein RN629_02040 [Sphingomonadaceae bacterium jetA1]|uniref:hypothetical protein n=1 Tax=Facivitalis istanbulensis TaxID=3075838 RepID=UPI003499710F